MSDIGDAWGEHIATQYQNLKASTDEVFDAHAGEGVVDVMNALRMALESRGISLDDAQMLPWAEGISAGRPVAWNVAQA